MLLLFKFKQKQNNTNTTSMHRQNSRFLLSLSFY